MPKTAVPTPPSQATLRKYGLTEAGWRLIVARQRGRCPICGQPLAGRHLNIDHRHVRGWKRMEPEDRRRHVRGVLHNFCNRYYVRRWACVPIVKALLTYLEEHEERSRSDAQTHLTPGCNGKPRSSK